MTIEMVAGVSPATLDPLTEEPSATVRQWDYIMVHHTGAEEKNTEQIRRAHKALGWLDIGYHWVIEPDGNLVRGRSDNLPGAHCAAGGMNHIAIGLAVIGNFENRKPYQAQIESINRSIVRLMSLYDIHNSSYVIPHKMMDATACPGKHFNPGWLKPLRLVLNGKVRPVELRRIDPTYTEMRVNDHWVGARAMLESIGADVSWNGAENTVVAKIY